MMIRDLRRPAAAWVVLAVMISLFRQDCSSATCAHGRDCNGCHSVCEYCCPTMEEAAEEKSCWNVKCEKVCVPAFRLPWQPGGSKLTLFSWLEKREHRRCSMACSDGANHNGPRDASGGCHCSRPPCGAVRCVRVLEEETVEISTSKCKWEIRPLPGCCSTDCSSRTSSESPASAMPEDEPNGALPPPPE